MWFETSFFFTPSRPSFDYPFLQLMRFVRILLYCDVYRKADNQFGEYGAIIQTCADDVILSLRVQAIKTRMSFDGLDATSSNWDGMWHHRTTLRGRSA